MASPVTPREPADRSSSHFNRRDPWAVLESLLAALTEATNSTKSIQLTVAAAAESISADAAFWYSKSSNRVLAVAGPRAVDEEWCQTFAQAMLARTPEADDVARWTNPPPSRPAEPAAALLCRSAKTHGCIIAVSFDPDRRFDDGDVKVARVTLKLLLSQRAQAQAGTKQMLLGLVHSLTTVIDAKDPYTAGHSERVARIATLIAKQMRLTPAQVGDVYLAGLLHDVGKIGVRDEVLQKVGRLSREEYEEIQQHPVIGDRIVASIKPFDRLRGAVRHHHERWDGAGYPDRLGKDEIPLLARVLAVADACDAMMSPRRYRPGRSPIDIDATFNREAGQQFDPTVVKAFMAVRHEIYPPIYQKGIGESAFHAIENIVDNLTESTGVKLPPLPRHDTSSK
jgi:HD-GYP domain-containing protein (c-di-GMP phosphodiesterase class II)